MKSDLVKIKILFPEALTVIKTKERLAKFLVKTMQEDKSINYAGYKEEKDLYKDLVWHLGRGSLTQYKPLLAKQRREIQETILATVKKCNKVLPSPTKIFIFVFPWFPVKNDEVFKGSFGFTPYHRVMHIFISSQNFISKSLADSVAHEINHIISYYYHPDRYGKWSLLDCMVNEGLAENFREEVIDKKSSPWAIALTKKEAFEVLKSINSLLDSQDSHIHQKILFGNAKYKRWTGYSIGYWLVKEFRRRHQELTWEEIMKTKSEDFLEVAIKDKTKYVNPFPKDGKWESVR